MAYKKHLVTDMGNGGASCSCCDHYIDGPRAFEAIYCPRCGCPFNEPETGLEEYGTSRFDFSRCN